MKSINDFTQPSLDAIDYRAKEKKGFFSASYFETDYMKKACTSNSYYLVGEKGTGKTALAFHIQETSPHGISAKLLSISETQYCRFVNLKKQGKLEHTDYSAIWRSTLLYLMSKLVINKKKKWVHKFNGKFKKIEESIGKFDHASRAPELEYVIEFIETLTAGGEISGTIPEIIDSKANINHSSSTKKIATELRQHLLESEGILKDGLESIKLDGDIVLFIDGLDAKPNDIDFEEYKKCLIGLSEANWHLNSEFFGTIKDSKGRMRLVLLIRPDVFDSLNLHNSNCRLEDNAVIFDWHTNNKNHITSELFKLSNKYFTSQSGNNSNDGWQAYFNENQGKKSPSFMQLLNLSFHRPRDIFAGLKILMELAKKDQQTQLSHSSISSPTFTDRYSEYLLGEVKNYANYYMTNSEFEECLAFFQYLHGSTKFNHDEYTAAYDAFIKSSTHREIQKIKITHTPQDFLQFWYDVNVIGYAEEIVDSHGDSHYHWSHRERSPAKVMPRIKENSTYMIHHGMTKSLNLGKKFINP